MPVTCGSSCSTRRPRRRCAAAANELIGRNNQELLPPAEAEFYDAIDREVLHSGEMRVSEAPFFTQALGERIMRTTTIVLSEDGAPRFLIGISDDVTDCRANEARIAHLAHHDALTDLPNRVLFCQGSRRSSPA